ncbi:xylose isomerase [Fistulifera solaris]|uniref:Xylose isomerase n=1 Tax=Fistulifera solaris TaxID=1519565 RepID=A0A1Z5K2M2_FISSO|nr:xylose isomerase [Fistulifera solaris]|eukprot:GAX20485.1 xylose isomerase [Fistulifera solaris]
MTEFFDAPKIEYKGPTSQDPLSFRHYNANEIILGKPMKEWLKFSVCFWHTLTGGGGSDPFGDKTLQRPWEDDVREDPLALAKRRIDVLFEFLTKLGVEYYTFHDIDVAPTGNSLEEFQHNLAIIGDYLLEKQQQTGVKLLWGTQNLFTNPRYMNGAMTNPDVHVFCTAAAQIQTMMDLVHKLQGSHHVFWGGREGYQTLLNTDLKKECDHMAAMYRMAVAYKQKKGYTAKFLLEPKPREPTKHQYDYDAQTAMAFLHEYGLSEHFQLNIEPNHTTLAGHSSEHDIAIASAYNMLGSIDCNTGDPILGWDVDLFPMNVQETAAIMGVVIQQGGLSGGLNFDAKVRRESVDPIDLFYAHIGSMDCYALGLRKAAALHEQGVLRQMLQQRYLTWSEDMGQRIERGEATLEECAEYAKKKGEPKLISGRQELYEVIRNQNLYPTN